MSALSFCLGGAWSDCFSFLSKLKYLSLEGLFSITDAQAKSLAKIELVYIRYNNYELIQGYKKP